MLTKPFLRTELATLGKRTFSLLPGTEAVMGLFPSAPHGASRPCVSYTDTSPGSMHQEKHSPEVDGTSMGSPPGVARGSTGQTPVFSRSSQNTRQPLSYSNIGPPLWTTAVSSSAAECAPCMVS